MNGDEVSSSPPLPHELDAHHTKPKWPLWRIVLTYLILLVIAFASIWVIDRRVDALAEPASGPQSTR